MSLTFLVPAFLAGLLALAIPIAVHLRNRERKEVVEFPSLMFLERIPYRAVRRQKIRHWFLLSLRALAIILLVGAFARPLLEGAELAGGAVLGARDVVVLLDRSYSMAYGERWAEARSAAEAVVDGLGPEDRATVVLFSTGATAVAPLTTDRSRLRAALDSAAVGYGTTRYGPALKLAQSLLQPSEAPRREVVLVTDFQKIGWDGGGDVRLPPGTRVTTVPVGGGETANVAVTDVVFQRERFSGRDRVTTSARLVNRNDEPARLSATLEIGGRELQSRDVELGASASAGVTFQPFTLAEADTRGTVRITPDALPQDDAFHFLLSPSRPVDVLLLGDPRAGENAELYVRRALDIGRDPGFVVRTKQARALAPSDLDGAGLVILNGAAVPGGAAGRALADYVRDGGGLLVVPGERSPWSDAAAELLPGRYGAPSSRPSGRSGAIGFIDYSHPIFELFRTPRSGDFADARFYRTRPIELGEDGRVLARFDDGAVALAERRVGAGRVLLWASTLDTFWNDLALKPVFLPFVHRMAQYLADWKEDRPWLTVGQVVDAATLEPDPDAAPARIALAPSGAQAPLRSDEGAPYLELTERGFYELRDGSGAGRAPITVAANLDLSESDLTPIDPREVSTAIAAPDAGPLTAGAVQLTPEDRERRQSLWWYLLAAAFVLLALETVLSNRMSRATGRSRV